MQNTDVVLVAMPFCDDYFACETIFAAAAHGRTLRSFDEYIAWMKQTHLPGKVFEGAQQQETLETLALFREAQEKAQDYLEEAAKRLKKEKDAPLTLAGGPNCHGDGGSALIMESLAWLVEKNILLKIGSEYLTLAVDRDAHLQSF